MNLETLCCCYGASWVYMLWEVVFVEWSEVVLMQLILGIVAILATGAWDNLLCLKNVTVTLVVFIDAVRCDYLPGGVACYVYVYRWICALPPLEFSVARGIAGNLLPSFVHWN